MSRECRNAKEFGDVFRATVFARTTGYTWKKDMRPWLGGMLAGRKFGDQEFSWTLDDAVCLGLEFVSEASTW